MIVTLEVITNIYSEKDKSKIIKKNCIYKKQFDTNQLLAEHFIDSKGNIIKKYCVVKQGDDYFKLNHKFEDISKLLQPIKVKGFHVHTK